MTLDEILTHTCWGHVCAYTQGLLCLILIKREKKNMWIQWPLFQNFNHKVNDP